MSLKNVATVDDLGYGLFKFFNVEYPKVPHTDNNSGNHFAANAVDFSYLVDLIGGKSFRRTVCPVHADYDFAVCCLSKLILIVEIIRSSVENGKFDKEWLTEFAQSVDSCKARYYYQSPALSVEGSVQADENEQEYCTCFFPSSFSACNKFFPDRSPTIAADDDEDEAQAEEDDDDDDIVEMIEGNDDSGDQDRADDQNSVEPFKKFSVPSQEHVIFTV